jgi:DNA-directed RNA polymerase subunit F
MKKILFGACFLLGALMIQAQPPAGHANPGDTYGEKISPDGAVPLSELQDRLAKDETVDGKIKAKIIEVCPKKGCWLKLQVNDSTTALVKMKEYAFFLPVAAKGKTVVIDGETKMKTTSVAELRHYAEDAKKSKEEIAAITKPEKEIRVTARGIVVVQ